MEEERVKIDRTDIENYFKKLEIFIKSIHPSQLFNCDESSDQINKKFKKRSVIVSNNDNETNYYYLEVKKGLVLRLLLEFGQI